MVQGIEFIAASDMASEAPPTYPAMYVGERHSYRRSAPGADRRIRFQVLPSPTNPSKGHLPRVPRGRRPSGAPPEHPAMFVDERHNVKRPTLGADRRVRFQVCLLFFYSSLLSSLELSDTQSI